MFRRLGLLVLLACPTVLVLTAGASAQCSMCRRALESGGNEGLLQGLYWSIALLLAVPASLTAAIATALVRAARNKPK